jgi:phage gp45-like
VITLTNSTTVRGNIKIDNNTETKSLNVTNESKFNGPVSVEINGNSYLQIDENELVGNLVIRKNQISINKPLIVRREMNITEKLTAKGNLTIK